MTLANRIIPTILLRNGKLIKGRQFRSDRVIGNALQAARVHATRGVDELVILNLDEKPDFEFIDLLTVNCFTPVAYAGGVDSIETIKKLFLHGIDKVIIKDSKHALIEEAAKHFGSQAIVACIDVPEDECNLLGRAVEAEKAGAGEILLQSMERDGTFAGYNLPQIRTVAKGVNIPVIASGGCAHYSDMVFALNAGVSAVAAGALFSFTNSTPKGAAAYLILHGYEARL